MLGRRPHYSQLAPPLSYIQADAFDSPKDLAAYLHLLSKNNELYNKYEYRNRKSFELLLSKDFKPIQIHIFHAKTGQK